MKRLMAVLVLSALAMPVFAAPAPVSVYGIRQDQDDIHRDRRRIYAQERDIDRDRAAVRHDRRELRRDLRNGNYAAAARERAEMRARERDIHRDRNYVRRQERDLWRDERGYYHYYPPF